MAEDLSPLSDAFASGVGRHALAAFTHAVAGRRQRVVLAHHATRRCRPSAQCLQSHAGFHARVSRDAALWRLDRGFAVDWRHRRDLESEDHSGRRPLSWFSETDRRGSHLQSLYSGGTVVGLFAELQRHPRHLLHSRHRARARRSAVFVADALILQNVTLRSLAFPAAWLSPHNSDRNSDSPRRPLEATSG